MTASNDAENAPRTPVQVTPDEVKVDLPPARPEPAHPDEDTTDDAPTPPVQ
jgi:hypothetical protein